MTIAVAFRIGSTTYLGADRRISTDVSRARARRPKVIQNLDADGKPTGHVFAVAGYLVVAQALEFQRLPRFPAKANACSYRRWLVTELIPELRKLCESIDQELDGEFIYVPPPPLDPVSISDWQIEHQRPALVGSGGFYALAAWEALGGLKLAPEALLDRMLKAALLDPSCGDGFDRYRVTAAGLERAPSPPGRLKPR